MNGDIGPTDDQARSIDRYLRRAVPFGFAGAVLLSTGEQIRLAAGYGWADRAERRENRSSTVFSLGSVTKPLTAAAVLVLVDQGRLSLSTPLGQLLSRVPADKSGLTIEQLLSHTGGLLDSTGEDFDPGDRPDVLGTIFAAPLRFEPGSTYAYSNAGYSVLAAVLEELTSDSYETALRRLVLEPATMTKTGYRLPDWDRSELAHFYVGDQDVGLHIDKTFPTWHVMGNGELLSTVHDLHRFTRAFGAGSLTGPDLVEQAWTPRHGAYGLGWSIGTRPHGRVVQHDGASTNGSSARLQYYAGSDTVLILLCNRDYGGSFLVNEVGPHLEARVWGNETPVPPAATVPSDRATPELHGDYEMENGRLSIRPTSAGSTATVTGQAMLDLVSGAEPDPERDALAARSLTIISALLAGDDGPLLAVADNVSDRVDRYRAFAIDRLGRDPSLVAVEGTLPVEISAGRAMAVQLGAPGPGPEQTLRLFWQGSDLVGLGSGTRPLMELPVAELANGGFALHPLGLGSTTVVVQRGQAISVQGETGVTHRLSRIQSAD